MRIAVPALFCVALALTAVPSASAEPSAASAAIAPPAGPAGDAAGAQPSIPPDGRIAFRVVRDEVDIGTHLVTFRRDGERLHVDVAIDLNVTFLGISLYRYRHRASETWLDGRLLALESTTDSNGRASSVSGRATGDAFVVRTEKGETTFPADALPSSDWNRRWIDGAALINTQTGERIAYTATPAGKEPVRTEQGLVSAQRFVIAGELRKEIWFDAGGRWLSTRFAGPDGSMISYLRQ